MRYLAVAALAALSIVVTPLVSQDDSARRIAPTFPGRRLALVIGNQQHLRKPLRNSRADARSMDELLRSNLHFTVTRVEDAKLAEMQRAIREFVRGVRPGDLVLFYYSGHGVQMQGVNWMIPVDFQADFEDEVADRAYSAQRVLKDLEDAGATVRILILDACRDNALPAARRSVRDGLVSMSGGEGTYFCSLPPRTRQPMTIRAAKMVCSPAICCSRWRSREQLWTLHSRKRGGRWRQRAEGNSVPGSRRIATVTSCC
jgi:hypothetical protein